MDHNFSSRRSGATCESQLIPPGSALVPQGRFPRLVPRLDFISSMLPQLFSWKNLPASAGDTGDVGSIPRPGRSSGEGHGNPL